MAPPGDGLIILTRTLHFDSGGVVLDAGLIVVLMMGRAVDQRGRVKIPLPSCNSIESTLNTYFYVPKLPFDEQTLHPGHLKHSRHHTLRHQPRGSGRTLPWKSDYLTVN